MNNYNIIVKFPRSPTEQLAFEYISINYFFNKFKKFLVFFLFY